MEKSNKFISEMLKNYVHGYDCACGKRHELTTKTIEIEKNIAPKIEKYISENFPQAKIAVICDGNTRTFAENIQKYISDCDIISLDINSFHAEEHMVTQAEDKIHKNYALFIAAGSGTIHDITRLIAYKKNVPFISYPTAPSVDGFISSVVPITKNGMKITLEASAPVAVFADTDIINDAPARLIYSGFGDLLGKYISLCDWKIANLLTEEYYCKELADILLRVTEEAKNTLNSPKFTETLLEGLLISGLCMQLVGNSRPASAAEHHIAHLLEMGILLECDNLHGENVGVGSVICAEEYRNFAEKLENNKLKFKATHSIDTKFIEKYFGATSSDILKENTPDTLSKIDKANLESVKNLIIAEIKKLPSAEELKKLLKTSEISHLQTKKLKHAASEIRPLAVLLAPYIRSRLTVMKLFRLFYEG